MTKDGQVRHYPIIDALRFVLAFWVVLSHFGMFPLFGGSGTSSWFIHTANRFWSTVAYGIPAVIGFFIISGFCIHLPFRHGEKLAVGPYYARRYIRILVPVSLALVVSRLAGDRQPILGRDSVLWSSVLWSLVCEEIYYAVYPFIRLIRKRFGWGLLLGTAFVAATAMLITKPHAQVWGDFGPWKTAFILFPVWLLGCLLAEQSDQLTPIDSTSAIWKWRFVAWAGSWACEVLNFKGGIPYTETMLLFGILTYMWIKKEISYGLHKEPSSLLVLGGAWSYSLYLMHYPAMDILGKLRLPNLGERLNWCVSYAFILGVSYVFYRAVEKPSHRLARTFRAIRSPSTGLAKRDISGSDEARPERSASSAAS